ncbi:uncharacterized protein DEA37_0002614 [Paragonimus westermani]|uniref:Uncharacterized protein n=1 Tax=Paragonimus westermani TaxID=34504 RepID=A0A5J4P056_9TREM|nr:uncharacterized protein DEA37_0002614 [Paragonimus westermani]
MFLSFFKTPRKTHFITVLRFLLRSFDDALLDRELSQHACPTSEAAFKFAASSCFRIIRTKLTLPCTFYRVMGYPGGAVGIEFLSVLSTFVLESRLSGLLDSDLNNVVKNVRDLVEAQHQDDAAFSVCCSYLKSLIAKRDAQLAAANETMKNTSLKINQIAAENGLLDEVTELTYIGGPTDTFQTYQELMISQVTANRNCLERLLADHSSVIQPQLSAVLQHWSGSNPTVLNAQQLKTTRVPRLLFEQFAGGNCDSIREGEEVNLHRLFHCFDSLFATASRLLNLPSCSDVGTGATNTITTDSSPASELLERPDPRTFDDSVVSWGLRVLQRTSAPLFQFSTLHSSTHDSHPSSSRLDDLVKEMQSSIASQQPSDLIESFRHLGRLSVFSPWQCGPTNLRSLTPTMRADAIRNVLLKSNDHVSTLLDHSSVLTDLRLPPNTTPSRISATKTADVSKSPISTVELMSGSQDRLHRSSRFLHNTGRFSAISVPSPLSTIMYDSGITPTARESVVRQASESLPPASRDISLLFSANLPSDSVCERSNQISRPADSAENQLIGASTPRSIDQTESPQLREHQNSLSSISLSFISSVKSLDRSASSLLGQYRDAPRTALKPLENVVNPKVEAVDSHFLRNLDFSLKRMDNLLEEAEQDSFNLIGKLQHFFTRRFPSLVSLSELPTLLIDRN